MSTIDWLLLCGAIGIFAFLWLCVLAILGIQRWWFGSITDELT